MIGMLRRRGPLGIYSITYDLDNVTKQGTAVEVIGGESFQDTLSTDAVMISVIVKMGGKDITSSAYNPTTKAISIPFVNGDIVITAIASPVIVFADQNVKSLCVTNWGGNYLQGEITEWEAAQVTSLNGVFRGNTNITSFDELRFFTGLTRISMMYSDGQGEFYDCRNLKSIILPSLNLSVADFRGMFKLCKSLKTLDLTPVKAKTYYIYQIANNIDIYGDLEEITIPGGYYGKGDSSTYSYMLYAFRDCRNLTTIHIDGVADFSGIGFFINGSNLGSTTFYRCTALTTITGTIVGINNTFNIQYSPLDHDTAVMLLNGLNDRSRNSLRTITFKASTYATLTTEEIAIATNKNWQVASA